MPFTRARNKEERATVCAGKVEARNFKNWDNTAIEKKTFGLGWKAYIVREWRNRSENTTGRAADFLEK